MLCSSDFKGEGVGGGGGGTGVMQNEYINGLLFFKIAPNGGQGCLTAFPCPESQGCHLFPLFCLLSCFSA